MTGGPAKITLVAGWLATKPSPHIRAAYLRDLAQWVGWLARHGVPLLEGMTPPWRCGPGTLRPPG